MAANQVCGFGTYGEQYNAMQPSRSSRFVPLGPFVVQSWVQIDDAGGGNQLQVDVGLRPLEGAKLRDQPGRSDRRSARPRSRSRVVFG